MKDRRCGTCRFFLKSSTGEFCRRYPQWTEVDNDGWCGEYQESLHLAGADTPLERLGLSSLLWGKLKDMGIDTIGDLLKEDPGRLHLRTNSTISQSSIHSILSALWNKGMISTEFEE